MSEYSDDAAITEKPGRGFVTGYVRERLKPMGRRTALEEAVETLRRAILYGQLPGGTHLVQQEIAVELGLSTTPVREALRLLEAEGLVDFDAHRGAVVRAVDAEEMQEIAWLRSLLEPLCMRLAAERADPGALTQAELIAEAMEAEADVSRWVTLNRQFHALLCEASGSRWLVSLLASLRSGQAIYVASSVRDAPKPMEPGNREHRALLDAIRVRNADAAEAIARHHAEAVLGHDPEHPEPKQTKRQTKGKK